MVLNILWLTLGTFIIGNFVGWGVHKLLHNPKMGKAYKGHLHHHAKTYPASNYLSDSYQGPPTGAGQGLYYIAAFALMCSPLIFWAWGYFAYSLVLSVLILKTYAYIHDTFHIRGHWLNRFKIYRWWNRLHYGHHVNVKTNLGIIMFFPDKLFGTFSSKVEMPDHYAKELYRT